MLSQMITLTIMATFFWYYFSHSRNHYPKMSTNELLKVSYCKIVKISPSEYMLLKKVFDK